MLIILVVILIISQIICFYVIALLNTKIAKFEELEQRQQQVIREMEDSISLYLVEMKEENDRLIRELSELNSSKGNLRSDEVISSHNETSDTNGNSTDEQPILEKKIHVPKTIVQNAYNMYRKNNINEEKKALDIEPVNNEEEVAFNKTEVDKQPISFEQQVIQLHKKGKSVEEIAKMTNKGMTEIELLLKFNA